MICESLGSAPFEELLSRLELVKRTAVFGADRLTSKGGRPLKNPGLEVLTRKSVDFWVEALGRPFTIGYPSKSGLTEGLGLCKHSYAGSKTYPRGRSLMHLGPSVSVAIPRVRLSGHPNPSRNSRQNRPRGKILARIQRHLSRQL